MNKPDDDDIILHPSTGDWYETFLDYGVTDPVVFVEGVLHELFIPFIQAIVRYGWDVESPQFTKDFTSLLEVTKAIFSVICPMTSVVLSVRSIMWSSRKLKLETLCSLPRH